jgi:hypothetical protein
MQRRRAQCPHRAMHRSLADDIGMRRPCADRLAIVALVELHNAVLLRLGVDWEAGLLSMDLRIGQSEVTIRASGLRKLSVVWAFPGAESKPVDRVDVGHEKLNIEMLGGGHIRVEAVNIDMP